jgi:hypothetical protein
LSDISYIGITNTGDNHHDHWQPYPHQPRPVDTGRADGRDRRITKGGFAPPPHQGKANMKTVNIYISDLFFNHDVSECRVLEDGEFVEFDRKKLVEEAKTFLNCIDNIAHDGVDIPTPNQLVDDFLKRI